MPAALVAQVLARPAVPPLFAGAAVVPGRFEWRGQHVPLLDPDRAFGLATGPAALAMVLSQGDRAVAVPIDAVVAVRILPAGSVQAGEDAGIAQPVLDGVAILDGVRVLVLDAAALMAAHAAPGLSAPRWGRDGGQNGVPAGKQATRAAAHVVFNTGRRWAISMDALEEILPLPAERTAAAATPAGPVRTCVWRGRALPLLDLREPRAEAPRKGCERLMVVRHAGHYLGLHVRAVLELVPARSGELTGFQAAGGAPVRMITTGHGTHRTSFPVLALQALAFFARGQAAPS